MQMIALSYFTYFAENALEKVAKKRERGELLGNSFFFSTSVSDVIQCLEISGVQRAWHMHILYVTRASSVAAGMRVIKAAEVFFLERSNTQNTNR